MRGLRRLGPALFAVLILGLAAVSAQAAVADIPYAMVVRIVSTDHYQIVVQNTNSTDFIKSFYYNPPAGLTITAVTGVQGGSCNLNSGGIDCVGKIVPATCNGCVGASMLVNFTATGLEPTFANGFWTYYGVVGGLEVTGTIPIEKPTFSDLPICKKGEANTKAHPCTKG